MVRFRTTLFLLLLAPLATSGCGGTGENALTLRASATTVTTGSTLNFFATGRLSNNLTWSINGTPGGTAELGTITAAGLYIAPQIPPNPNTVSVAATSNRKPQEFRSIDIAIENHVPTITTLSPDTGRAGDGNTVVQIVGTGMGPQTTLTVGGNAVEVTFVDENNLTTSIPSDLLMAAGILTLSTSNPAPGGGSSPGWQFPILNEGLVQTTNHPQVAQYSLTVPDEAMVHIEFGPDTSYGRETWSVSASPDNPADILVAGMKPFTLYHLRAVVEFPDGALHEDIDHTFTTGGLPPERIPPMTVTQDPELSPQSGVESILIRLWLDPAYIRAFVTDLDGDIIWYYDIPEDTGVIMDLMPNGNIALLVGGFAVRVIDLAGNTIKQVHRDDLNAQFAGMALDPLATQLHHDIRALPDGKLMVLGRYRKTFTDLDGLPGDTDMLGDTIIVLDENLVPVWTWNSFDHLDQLDINRHPFRFDLTSGARIDWDWLHTNALTYSPADGNLIMSQRTQHWVIKINYQDGFGDGRLLWRLGFEGDLTLPNESASDWQFAQHYPIVVDDQVGFYRIAVFDNGDGRPVDAEGTPCGGLDVAPCYSRAVLFEIDEAQSSARIHWEETLPIFSPIMGSIQMLPNGNIESTSANDNMIERALIREVTFETPPKLVWQLELTEAFVPRGLRMPSLYPGIQW